MLNEYMGLSTRAGFNRSLGHFRVVSETLSMLKDGINLSDIVEELENEKLIRKVQVPALLNSVLVEKFEYSTISFNLKRYVPDYKEISQIVKNWNNFDITIAYHHPQLGITLINPQNDEHWKVAGDFGAEELVVIYTRAFHKKDETKEGRLLVNLKDIFEGTTTASPAEYCDPTKIYRPPFEEDEVIPVKETNDTEFVQGGSKKSKSKPLEKRKMTPKYSCQVTNELFHNGNVEAWKNIIESYALKYPELEVYVFHDGKRVNNLNSLFKWGKVKHGDAILFSIVGENFKDVSKLQRYLFEGASSRYETFLKKDVNKPLNLF
ncbi:MAG: hypothetical protein ACI86H_000223 [bacterium]|jgi:hypothetical protein